MAKQAATVEMSAVLAPVAGSWALKDDSFRDRLAPAHPSSHLVQFYDGDEFLFDGVTRFIGAGLAGGEGVVVIATAEHLVGLERLLARNSLDCERARRSGQLTLLDADETLRRFMVGGRPDADRFRKVIVPVVERSGRGRGGIVRAYGEMVDVLCQQGNHAAALELERSWNGLIAEHPLSLLCGYSMRSFARAEDAESFRHVCQEHTYVAPSESFSALRSEDERLREVSQLEQRARALETQIEQSRVLERRLRQREAELQDLFDNAAEGIHWVGADGKIIWANRAELELLGYSAEEYVGRSIAEFHVDQELIAQILAKLTRGEQLRNVDALLRAKDGSLRHVLISSNAYQRDGEFVHSRCFTRDITERKRTESELKEQQRVTEILLSVSRMLNSELDFDSLMQKLVDEAAALCRAEVGSFLCSATSDSGDSHWVHTRAGLAAARRAMPRSTDVFASRSGALSVVRVDDLAQEAHGRLRDARSAQPDGAFVTSYLAVPVKTPAGDLLGGLFFGHSQAGMFSEADERLLVALSAQAAIAIEKARSYQAARRAEKKALLERKRLHDLFMQAPAAIAILRGRDHVVEFANPVAIELLRGRAVLDRRLAEIVPEIDRSVLDHVFVTGQRHVGTASAALDWNGDGQSQPRFFNVACEPLRDEDGDIAGVMTFGFEITEQVMARRRVEAMVEQLEIANRTKDDFLATVSHELRTPLNAMLGWTRMLRAGAVSEAQRSKALETVERNAKAQAALIEDLLDVSRIISGKMRLEIQAVDVLSVVANAIDAVRPAASAKGVELLRELDADASPIWGDSARLQQVIWNLLSNGVKFTPRGGRVQIAVHRRESFVEISVSDNGQGIDSEFLPYVFERFRQADPSTVRKHMGLGLGLAIVRHLVELHGGNVTVQSAGPGQGAEFLVQLPLAPVRASSIEQLPAIRQPMPSPQLAYPPELAGLHVLILEDDTDARELLVQVLEPCGARVSAVGSVPEALQAFERTRPDLIVSDIGLPGEDGYAFIKRIRSFPASEGGTIRAVALTAYARVEDRTKALVAGFDRHMTKPVEPAELMAMLASLAPPSRRS